MIRPARDLQDRLKVNHHDSTSAPVSQLNSTGRPNGSDDAAGQAKGHLLFSKRRGSLAQRFRLAAGTSLLMLANLTLLALVYWLAFGMRFDFRIPSDWMLLLWVTAPFVLALKSAVFYATGQHHGWWSHVTFADLVALVRAAVLSLGVVAAIDYFLFPKQIPRSVLLLDCVMTIVLFGAVRASGRVFVEHV